MDPFKCSKVSAEYPSYLTPKAEGRQVGSKGGKAVFALKPIIPGETVAIFGGIIVSLEEVVSLNSTERLRVLQVSSEGFLFSTKECASDWINHSCDPNCGFLDAVTLVAMRPIAQDEEITFDYAMADSTSYDEFPCACGASGCRSFVRATDWNLSELRTKYNGFFSPYLREF